MATTGHMRTAQYYFLWWCCTVPPTTTPMVQQRYGHGTAACTGGRSQLVKRAVMASVGGLERRYLGATGRWRRAGDGGCAMPRGTVGLGRLAQSENNSPNFASASRRELAWDRAMAGRARQSIREPTRFDTSHGRRHLYWRRRKMTLAGASLAHAISAIDTRFCKWRSEDRCETCR